jgi:hypothetical protein
LVLLQIMDMSRSMLSTWFPKVILAVSEEVVHEEELQEEPMAVKDENWF